MSKHGLLLIGHGSRLHHNKELFTSTAELMDEKTDEYMIRSCFMENSSPTVIEGIDEMKKRISIFLSSFRCSFQKGSMCSMISRNFLVLILTNIGETLRWTMVRPSLSYMQIRSEKIRCSQT